MNPSAKLDTPIAKLFSAACDENLTDEQRKSLAAMLADDDVVLDDYLFYSLMHAELRQSVRARQCVQAAIGVALSIDQSVDSDQPLAPQDSPITALQLRRKSLLDRTLKHGLAVGIAVSVMFFAGLLWSLYVMKVSDRVAEHLAEQASKAEKAEQAQKSDVVAWLMAVKDVKWTGGIKPQGTRYKDGQKLAIDQGLIQIQYKTGAEVVIEGPAEYWVGGQESGDRDQESAVRSQETARSSTPHPSSSNSGYLALGKLVARCKSARSKGFTIHTPSGARVEDLGTEFGVDVDEEGEEFAVLTGKVVLISVDGSGREQRVELAKDQGAFVEADGGAIVRRDKVDAQLVAVLRNRFESKFVTSSQGVVTVFDFDGTDDLTNVTATASSENGGATYEIANAFLNDSNAKKWAAAGGVFDPTVTIDLTSALLDGSGGSFKIDTFSFEDWHTNATSSTASFQLQAFTGGTGGTEVFNATYTVGDDGPWSPKSPASFSLGGVVADTILYTVLSRVDETSDGLVGASEFTLTGSLITVPEPSADMGLQKDQ